MNTQDLIILMLGIGLVATWVIGARIVRRLSADLDAIARDRVPFDEAQGTVGRTLGQLQLAADDLTDALASRSERLNELMAESDARSATLAEAIAVAGMLVERMAQEAVIGPPVTFPAPDLEADPQPVAVTADRVNGASNGAVHPLEADGGWDREVGAPDVVTEGPASAAALEGLTLEVEAAAPPAGADIVRHLAREGMDLATIARLTNRGREEVRLLLRFAGVGRGIDGRRAAGGGTRPESRAAG